MVRALQRAFLALSALALLGPAGPALALVDIPTSDRRALAVVDLASGAGVAMPAEPASLPLDDQTYLDAYRALSRRGLTDPLGERLERWEEARANGALHLEFLAPRLELRPHHLGGGAERRLLYHRSGEALEPGFNTFFSASGVAFWGRRLGGAYELQAQQEPGDLRYRTRRLYLKAPWGKWSFKVGRDAERLGPGYHGSLLLDDNAPTMDLWRVRTEEPLFLPGPLAGLGGFRFTLFNAFLSDNDPDAPDPRYGNGQDPVDDPRLLGMRVSYHPSPWFDLGVSRAIYYGGKGREVYDSPRDWWELFTATNENVDPGESDRYDNDQYVAFDATLRLPILNGLGPLRGGKLYWEYAGTDIISRWQGENTGGWEPFKLNRVANLGGVHLSTAVTDFRFEYANTDPAWYRNGQYPQGYTYLGRPLGHHMGGDAWNWFAEVSRYFGTAWRASLAFDLERRGRSLPSPEDRAEWSLGVEALRLEAFGVPFEARLDALAAHVESPLDDPRRVDRNEVYVGLSLGIEL